MLELHRDLLACISAYDDAGRPVSAAGRREPSWLAWENRYPQLGRIADKSAEG